MGAREDENGAISMQACARFLQELCSLLLYGLWFAIAILLVGLCACAIWEVATSADPEFSVAVGAVRGLDPALDLRSFRRRTLAPVLNMTVHVNNLNKIDDQVCLGGLSTKVAVSYGNAVLSQGKRAEVPWFCLKSMQEGRRETTAWGLNVEMPRFLRERLAADLERGEAVLDATMKTKPPSDCKRICRPSMTIVPDDRDDDMPSYFDCELSRYRCSKHVIACKVKIGGGLCPCTLES